MGMILPLIIVASCLFGRAFSDRCPLFREFQSALLSADWMLLVCLTIWCGTLILLTFTRKDWPLIGLLSVVIIWYCIGSTAASRALDAVILLVCLILGRGAGFVLKAEGRWPMASEGNHAACVTRFTSLVTFLVGLVVLLAFLSWLHLEPTGAYRGPRWMGLWDNPNIYGMLMGAGVVLSAGLLADRRWRMEDSIQKRSLFRFGSALKSAIRHLPSAILLIAIFMLGVGLVMSYSRGAWLGAAIGLLYLSWSYDKLKWRHIVIGSSVLILGAGLFWGQTADSAPWYVKRADLGRPSAQNRVTAWRAGLEIMRDHPLGVGWNNAVKIYRQKYSPPEGGPGALTTNDYMVLGTELGIAALFCFVSYCGLRLRGKCRMENEESRIQAACRAGAIVLLVAFWFDGGLFKLPTATVFWVLLELGVARSELMVDKPKTA